MLLLVIFSLPLLLLQAVEGKVTREKDEYCKFKCGEQHIACQSKRAPGPSCPKKKIETIVMDKSMQKLILEIHNDMRSEVASGAFNHLPSAARMARLSWDAELAMLAQIKALLCSYDKDECHSTKKFPNPGQNIAWQQYLNEKKRFTSKKLVEDQIRDWFHENSECHETHAYNVKSKDKHFCCFTLAIMDKNTHIGCGAIRYEVKPQIFFHMVCNYSQKNVAGEDLYKVGNATSGCKTGKDKRYKYLCSTKEKYS